jgi:hypothetical protein
VGRLKAVKKRRLKNSAEDDFASEGIEIKGSGNWENG